MIQVERPRSTRPRRARSSRNQTPAFLLVLVGLSAFSLNDHAPRSATALNADSSRSVPVLTAQIHRIVAELDGRAQRLRRAQTIATFARTYRVSTRLAGDIFVAAENARVDPDLAFRLVRLESDFDERAVSPVGALGLTQVMPSTARTLDPNITDEQLFDRHVNLRLGLRYLRMMLEQHDNDVALALAAYNRGPGAVRLLLAEGKVPSNAYERVIMRGYTGKGILD
jgi:soluble lytic murein transglycosylase-like protein